MLWCEMMRQPIRMLAAPLLAVPFALAMAAAAPAAAQDAITPGYWETTNQMISPLPSSKVERRCIKPADVAKFMQGPSNHIYTCTYPTREIGGGKIRLKGSCATKDGKPVPISGEGAFTGDTFRVDARIDTQLGGLSIPVRARTTAKRLGDTCPAETAAG
ncbi:MAG: hypothetical protein JWP28_531 [Phenylobacterium sp.]|nr:hypothetical protein [Phenylobacterium sp.]MDB5496500.1 hypothetical protein [Phenylobacterium sp.]